MSEFLSFPLYKNGDFTLSVGTLVSISLLLLFTRLLLLVLKKLVFRFFEVRKVEKSRREAIYLLIKYFLWTVAIAAAMEMVGIHVTILIAGSAALLVGLGLGLQQIFQDLVSGIFILIEGTIKVGDVIEMDGMVGSVLSVNLRTSEIFTRDGIMIIVPNHKFIIEKITNWSHNSESTRFKVEVGIAYGSDVEKVKQILLECAKNHSEVILGDKEIDHSPFVRFVDFGESALKFEVYFWTTNIFHVEFTKSDLRFAIDKKFREQGVVIPFPQRVVHLPGK